MRTPAQISRWLDEHLHQMDLPSQWLGDEPNSRRKPWDAATVRWCLVASWPYEQAAGNQSIPTVYAAINDAHPDYLCDRTYLPVSARDLGLLERHRIPMFGVESRHPLADFDVVGTSISYPVLSLSFVKLLTMSAIPLRWRDRDPGRHPMVIVGGLSYTAPEVLAPVVDCWFLGEVEDEPGNPGIAAVTDRIARFKATGRWVDDRVGCYADLAREFRFLYFPRFVDVRYHYEDRSHLGVGPHPSKQVASITSNLDGMRLPLVKRHVKNLDAIRPLVDPPLLYVDPAMGSGDLEVARGCPAWCVFCSLTYSQKPYRQRSVDYIVDYAQQLARNMGSVRMAPFSPDFPMYTQRKKLIAALLEKVSDEVDAPSMRVDDFVADDQFILLQVHGGMDAVTLGVEGNSQRMRDLVGKGTADADIREAVTRGIRAGIRKIKLFMISNLPGETEGDVFRILSLAKDLADIREQMNQPTVRIQFSWTPLLIEANTPMQWFAPTPQSRVLGDVWEECRELKIEFKLGSKAEPNRSAFFQLAQRASRDVGEALVDAMAEIDQACWGGVPRTFRDLLDTKLRERGFRNGFADCFDERDRNDLFGWEMVDQGISTQLMWTTYVQMREFLTNTDPHTYDRTLPGDYHGSEWLMRCDTNCYGKQCGACDHADLKIRTGYIRAAQHERDVHLSTLVSVDQRSQAQRIRARLHKPASHRFVDNAHWRFALRRAAFRAQHQLGLAHGIAKRSLRFVSDDNNHRNWICGTDYVDLAFTRPNPPATLTAFIDAMNTHLAGWLHIGDWAVQPLRGPGLRTLTDLSLFELEVDEDPTTLLARLAGWHAAADVPMKLRVDGGYFAPATEDVNAKDYVEDIWPVRDGFRLKLRMLLRGRPTPHDIYAALTGRASRLDTAHAVAVRLDAFVVADRRQQDFLRPNCRDCALQIPVNMLDRPYHPDRCPRCQDSADGVLVA